MRKPLRTALLLAGALLLSGCRPPAPPPPKPGPPPPVGPAAGQSAPAFSLLDSKGAELARFSGYQGVKAMSAFFRNAKP